MQRGRLHVSFVLLVHIIIDPFASRLTLICWSVAARGFVVPQCLGQTFVLPPPSS